MKCTKLAMVAVCGALMLAVTGCKYDDDGSDTANGADVAQAGDDNAAGKDLGGEGADLGKVTGGDGLPATAVPFDQLYKRCTDVDFAPVYFGFDASNLAPAELAKVEAVAKHLTERQDRVTIIEGNCDERGSNEYNLSLGELRAIAIRDYLVRLGISADRIQTKSYGEEKPAVQGQGEAVWSKNRRGEFAIYQK